ncbi:MAG TPA: flagellar export protein FliJ [Steroidobacteraceae bacterium]|nr:flagellar export protein FliJ [Steroidobacteraceae bacterium]
MSRSERIQPIKDIADTRERNAGAVVAQAERALRDREQQLAQLKKYLDEYVRKNTPGIGSVDPIRLNNYRAFLARLTEAVRAQEQLVEQASREYERKREDWRVQHVEAAALGRAVERMQLFERTEQGRREQKESDEDTSNRRR